MKLKLIKLLSVLLVLSIVNSALYAQEEISSCKLKNDEAVLLKSLNISYLQFSSLYTGGIHFKELGSADESFIIYLALTNQFDKINEINRQKEHTENTDKIRLYDTQSYLRRFSSQGWGMEKNYELSPDEVIVSAQNVVLKVKKSYKHLNELKLPYAFHYRQAGFDLDVFTSIVQPVDWWLKDTSGLPINKIKQAIQKASKKNDFIDWLQFITTSSALPHLQNWNFKNFSERKEGYQTLKKHAADKWLQTKSYAWLAALSEVADSDDNASEIILKEFDILSKKVSTCNASQLERVAHSMILTNAIRLGYKSKYDIYKWIATLKNESYERLNNSVLNRLNQYTLEHETFEEYQIVNKKIKKRFPILILPAISANNATDFIARDNNKSKYLSNVELSFISKFTNTDLIKIAQQKNLSVYDKKEILRSAFLRSWVNNDLGDTKLLKVLVEIEPSLGLEISAILNEENKTQRKAKLLKLIMGNPGFTYLLGVELFGEGSYRPIEEFSMYNAEDGSWWCTTDIDYIVNRNIEAIVRPFGLTGYDNKRSGGRYGTMFNNPGQKRASLRNERIVIDYDLNKEVSTKLKKHHKLLQYSTDKQWMRFSKLPAAPIYFSKKVHELENSKEIDKETMISLYKLLIRSAKRTCRQEKGVYDTLKDARENLSKYNSIDVKNK